MSGGSVRTTKFEKFGLRGRRVLTDQCAAEEIESAEGWLGGLVG